MDVYLQNDVTIHEGTRYEFEGVVDTFGWRMAVWQMVNRRYLKVPKISDLTEEFSIDEKESRIPMVDIQMSIVKGVVIGRKS